MEGFAATMRQILEAPDRLENLRQGALQTDLSAWELETLGARTTALYDFTASTPSAEHIVEKAA